MKTQFNSIQQKIFRTLMLSSLAMLFCILANPMYAQGAERTVKGIVNSVDGPVFGAAIVLKGTAIGITTDENGTFTFPEQLKENDVLVVSYFGYPNKEVTITGDAAYIQPFFEDNPLVIVAALRTEDPSKSSDNKMN